MHLFCIFPSTFPDIKSIAIGLDLIEIAYTAPYSKYLNNNFNILIHCISFDWLWEIKREGASALLPVDVTEYAELFMFISRRNVLLR